MGALIANILLSNNEAAILTSKKIKDIINKGLLPAENNVQVIKSAIDMMVSGDMLLNNDREDVIMTKIEVIFIYLSDICTECLKKVNDNTRQL